MFNEFKLVLISILSLENINMLILCNYMLSIDVSRFSNFKSLVSSYSKLLTLLEVIYILQNVTCNSENIYDIYEWIKLVIVMITAV